MDKYRRARRAKVKHWYENHRAVLAWRACAMMKWGYVPSLIQHDGWRKEMSAEEMVLFEAYMRIDDEYAYKIVRIIRDGKY